MKDRYWDHVYLKKKENEVSWFQENPKTSIDLIQEFGLRSSDKIIDIDGGDSRLVDNLFTPKGVTQSFVYCGFLELFVPMKS
ncbi:MAG: hypothetical protein COT74_00635 [Bdellovibrionales bacterium CG10_big_fil_rev_8_21_14_0_10_45_34]|nr:MAG: hypothetical protein COT74_00635 [Bdellovibrionales bacterium CG10_big_fil_rev_8_21_14_0_10_45_34]